MVRVARKALPWLWLSGSMASAEYTEFFFTTAESNWKCPGMTFDCVPPRLYSFNPLLNKHVCCDSGSPDEVCWTGSSTCDSNPTRCGSGDNSWCCLGQREMCTQSKGQLNICWETATNPIANLSSQKVNDTFSALSSANPAASTLLFDLAAATATSSSFTPSSSSETSTIVSASSSENTATSSPSTPHTTATSSQSTTQSTPFNAPTTQPTISSGATSSPDNRPPASVFAGAIIGGVVGLAFIVGIIFVVVRKRHAKLAENPYGQRMAGNQILQRYYYAHEVDGVPLPAELPAVHEPRELNGRKSAELETKTSGLL